MSDSLNAANGAASSQSVRHRGPGLDLPSIEKIISSFPEKPPSLPPRGKVTLSEQKQEQLLDALKKAIATFRGEADVGNGFDLKELHASLEQTDANYNLPSVPIILDQLWQCNSELLIDAAETLANESRDRESLSC